MEKRYQVFVSSTYTDLKQERQEVMQTLMEINCIPSGMELFPAFDEEQFRFIKTVIDDSDYYVLIIGGRYGSVTKEGISYTELEYDYAVKKGLKVLAFIHAEPENIAAKNSEMDPDLRARLNKFRDKVASGRLVKFWKDTKELPGLVAVSLMRTIKSSPAIGWVRADSLDDLQYYKSKFRESETKGLNDLDVIEIRNSRQSFGNYFSKISNEATKEVTCVFVTGGFIPGVELVDTISNNRHIKYKFYLLDRSSPHKLKRQQDTYDMYEVGKDGDGYDEIIDISNKHPDQVKLYYYDEYPFWHYSMIDNKVLYMSYNPLGNIGYTTSPVYVLENKGSTKGLFNTHYEHLRLIKRNAFERTSTLE